MCPVIIHVSKETVVTINMMKDQENFLKPRHNFGVSKTRRKRKYYNHMAKHIEREYIYIYPQ